MKETAHTKAHLTKLLDSLKKKFEIGVQHLEGKNEPAAVNFTGETLKEIKELVKILGNDYESSIYTWKMPDFDKNNDKIKNWGSTEQTDHNLAAIVRRTAGYIRVLDAEVCRRYTSPFSWSTLFGKYQRQIRIGAVSAAAILVVVVGAYKLWISGHGLLGQYYSGTNFEELYEQRLDSEVNFQWKGGSPFPKWNRDFYSVRWIGRLEAPKSGRYEFLTQSDDGVRLWIDDKPVLENWTTHSVKTDRGGLFLEKGLHEIKLEYFEFNSDAVICLLWRRSHMPKPEIIPARYLLPAPKTDR